MLLLQTGARSISKNSGQQYRDQAEESIVFADVTAKAWYDEKHKPVSRKCGKKVFLKLGRRAKLKEETGPALQMRTHKPFYLHEVGIPPARFDVEFREFI